MTQSCQHDPYWRSIYDNCMACRAEMAEQRVAVQAVEIEWLQARLNKITGWQHCDTHSAINADHAWGCPECVRELRDEIERLKHDHAQLQEVYEAARKGCPLGPVICAQTIVNQELEIKRLKAELAALVEKMKHETV